MSETNALQMVSELLAELVAPLAEATRDDASFGRFLARFGWSARTVDLDDVVASVNTLVETLTSLGDDLSFDSLPELVQTLESLSGTAQALTDFAVALGQAAGDPGGAADVVGALAADLLEHLLLTLIAKKSRPVYSTLSLLGIIDQRVATALATAGPDPLLQRVAVERPGLAPEALGMLLSDPVGHLRAQLGVQQLTSPEVAVEVLARTLGPVRDLVVSAGGIGTLGSDPRLATGTQEPTAALVLPLPVNGGADVRSTVSLVVTLVPLGATGPAGDSGPGVSIEPGGALEVALPLPGARLELELSGSVGTVFFPQGGSPVVHAQSDVGVLLRVGFTTVAPEGAPAVVLGAGGLGLTVTGVRSHLEARFGRADDPVLAVEVGAAVERASFRITPGEGDGFLAKVLPSDGIRVEFELGLGWSTSRGLYLTGAASLDAEFPVHVSLLGVLTVDLVHLRLSADDTGIGASVAVTATLKLGPVVATVERMGLDLQAAHAPGGGNGGPFDLEPRFLPPRGAGLRIDAAVVTGGGFVLNDPERGRYAGILDLRIGEIVTVTAIGLVTTQMPDQSRGFSMIVILTATFPPIQLGFGFTLGGLGGILGLNRTMNVDALRDGVRTRVLESILFPVDPVARATKVISDIEAVFPVAKGRFVIGLLARIGWGTPQLVTVDLGVIVELPLPLRIALIGRVGVLLPAEEAAIVKLQVDIVGILDLDRGELSIDASLYDSRLAVFELTGDMAVRVGWGATPAFVVSVGGLNPRFPRPAGLPDLRRLAIALATGDNPSVRLEAYLALTSNTIQVGARLSAHAELDAGFLGRFSGDVYFGFDALVTIRPFEFIVDIAGGITVRRNGTPFIGAEVLLTLYGPQPMRALGYVEVHFLGTHRIPFDVTVGPPPPASALTAVNPLEILLAELGRVESWSAAPARDEVGVSVRESRTEALIAHPLGTLTVRQRAVPLAIRIERYAGAPILGGPRTYSPTYRVGGADAPGGTPVTDAWAPGDLFNLRDDQKLSRPSFEQLPSGHTDITAVGLTHGGARHGAAAEYETRVIDEDDLARPAASYQVPAAAQPLVAAFGTIHTEVGYTGPPGPVHVRAPSYLVVDTTTLAPDGGEHGSWVEAEHARAGRAGMQVITVHEVSP